MTYKELQLWIQQIEKLNPTNQELMEEIKTLKRIVDLCNVATIFNDVKNSIQAIAELDKLNKINYGEEMLTAEALAKELNLYDFQASLPISKVHKKLPPPDPPPTIETQILKIFQTYKDRVVQEITKLQQDNLTWHQRFVDHQVETRDHSTENFVNFSSIYNRGEPRVTPPKVGYKSNDVITDYSLSNGDIIKEKAATKSEEISQYSMILAEKSRSYNSNFESFKSEFIYDDCCKVKNDLAVEALNAIVELIENTKWQTWRSRSRIEVDGEEKAVPNHIYEIYQKAQEGISDPRKASSSMEEINEIATRALKHMPSIFKELRKRDEQTQKAYEEIARQTAPK
ncbi:hypothetical protein [Legionella sp. WA2024007413]